MTLKMQIFIRTLLLMTAILFGTIAASAQTAHKVVVSWNASPDAAANPTLTYNVYRGATCSNLTKINSSPVSILTYTDTTVSLGSYCYAATSVVNGVESVDSNTATVVILPSPPTSLAAQPS